MKLTTLLILCSFLLMGLVSCRSDKTAAPPEPEYLEFTFKGMAPDVPSEAVASSTYNALTELNVNAISISPKAILPGGADSIEYDRSGFAWGEVTAGITQQIVDAKAQGMNVLMAPVIEFPPAVSSETFDAGDDWEDFNASYLKFILHFAELAESEEVDVFSVGANMENYIKEQEAFWFQLIDSVKSRFSGALTYSANWKNYDDVPFWTELDFVGVEAYWSVSLSETPDAGVVEQFWEMSVMPDLSSFSVSVQRPVVFTSIGYRSIDFSGEKPWDADVSGTANATAQSGCLEGFFEAFRNKDWFVGAFVRGWTYDESNSGLTDDSYSPQGKPAESLIQEVYLDSL